MNSKGDRIAVNDSTGRIGMDKKVKGYRNMIIIAFVIKSVLYFIGNNDWPSEIIKLFFGNQVLLEIGSQLIPLVGILILLDVSGGIVQGVKKQFAQNTEAFWGGRQSNGFFLGFLTAFVAGIILLGGGVFLTYYKTGGFAVIFMFAAGIVSEIAAICFGFLHHKVMKQMIDIHKLTNKKEQFQFLMQTVERLEHKEEMMTEIVENLLHDCMEEQ